MYVNGAMQRFVQQRLAESLASGQIVWINPLHTLCQQTECLLVDKGILYFRDFTHLSEAGAMLFSEDFARALETITQQ